MLTAICISLILLTVLAFAIIAEVRADIDIISGKNSVTFFLFGLKVVRIDVDFVRSEEDVFRIDIKNGDNLLTSLSLGDVNKINVKETAESALPNPFYNLDIVEIEVSAMLGSENALGTVAAVMVSKWLIEGARLLIKSSQRVKVLSYVKPVFNDSAIIINLSGIFSITIADIIYGIILGKRRKVKQ